MRSTSQMLLVALLIGVVLAAPVAAATSQGLEWGVATGDRFNFLLEMESETDSVSEGLYIVVDEPSTIPDVVAAWADVGMVSFDVFWTNGTAVFWMILPFIFAPLEFVSHRICVPAGNYVLLSELLRDEYTVNVTTTDGYYYWGATYYNNLGAGYTMQITVLYLKSDGFLASYRWTNTNATDTTFTMSMVRDGLPSDIQVFIMDNILFIGIGVVVLVVLGAVVCKKR